MSGRVPERAVLRSGGGREAVSDRIRVKPEQWVVAHPYIRTAKLSVAFWCPCCGDCVWRVCVDGRLHDFRCDNEACAFAGNVMFEGWWGWKP